MKPAFIPDLRLNLPIMHTVSQLKQKSGKKSKKSNTKRSGVISRTSRQSGQELQDNGSPVQLFTLSSNFNNQEEHQETSRSLFGEVENNQT